ncbi:hypothetical protein RJ640_002210 [Escallonia rubra]|uniref:Uncharacterized protein n=1 Tax=Escallonia rubra TaxID=112253 RepID=A0AA88RDU3_9ASTE|nr:hypothetical protein RJ640_002210 [Escallonia rubra]
METPDDCICRNKSTREGRMQEEDWARVPAELQSSKKLKAYETTQELNQLTNAARLPPEPFITAESKGATDGNKGTEDNGCCGRRRGTGGGGIGITITTTVAAAAFKKTFIHALCLHFLTWLSEKMCQLKIDFAQVGTNLFAMSMEPSYS